VDLYVYDMWYALAPRGGVGMRYFSLDQARISDGVRAVLVDSLVGHRHCIF